MACWVSFLNPTPTAPAINQHLNYAMWRLLANPILCERIHAMWRPPASLSLIGFNRRFPPRPRYSPDRRLFQSEPARFPPLQLSSPTVLQVYLECRCLWFPAKWLPDHVTYFPHPIMIKRGEFNSLYFRIVIFMNDIYVINFIYPRLF